MKRNIFWLGMLVIILTFGMTVVGCDDGSTNDNGGAQTVTYSGTANGATYTLLITENTARYAAQSGDAYALTVGAKKSTGTVDNVSGGDLTLKPSNAATTFTATVSGSSLTAMNGTITWTDNTTEAAPETLTPVVPPVGGAGTFTLTGIPSEHNGKYAYINTTDIGRDQIFGAQSSEKQTEYIYTLCIISNGSVSIPMWRIDYSESPTTTVRYSGNDTAYIVVKICNTQTGNDTTLESSLIDSVVFSNVTFANGGAARTWGGTPPVVPPVGTGGLSGTWYVYQESLSAGTETVTQTVLFTYAFDNANIEYITSITETSTGANQKQGYKGTYSADNGTLTATYNQLLGETLNRSFSSLGLTFASTWYTQAEAEAVIQNSELSEQYKTSALQSIRGGFESLTYLSSVSTNYAISGNQMTFTRDGVEGSTVLWKYTSGGAVTVHATHNWGAWTVTRPATETENGSERRTCTDPAHGQSRPIPAGTSGGEPPNPGTGGTFTLSGIPSQHNGKYAYLNVTGVSTPIYGWQSINQTTGVMTLVPISGGSVTIPLWTQDNNENVIGYSGAHTGGVSVVLFNTQTVTGDNFESATGYIVFTSVAFSSGSASRAWSAGQWTGQ